jgi:hypothetical protein
LSAGEISFADGFSVAAAHELVATFDLVLDALAKTEKRQDHHDDDDCADDVDESVHEIALCVG